MEELQRDLYIQGHNKEIWDPAHWRGGAMREGASIRGRSIHGR